MPLSFRIAGAQLPSARSRSVGAESLSSTRDQSIERKATAWCISPRFSNAGSGVLDHTSRVLPAPSCTITVFFQAERATARSNTSCSDRPDLRAAAASALSPAGCCSRRSCLASRDSVSVGRKMGWGARESSESSAPPQTSRSWERSPRRDGRGGGDFDSIDGEECVLKERDLVDEVTVLGPGDVSQVGAVPRRWVLGDGAAASPEVAPRGPGRSVRGIRGRSAGVERRT